MKRFLVTCEAVHRVFVDAENMSDAMSKGDKIVMDNGNTVAVVHVTHCEPAETPDELRAVGVRYRQ